MAEGETGKSNTLVIIIDVNPVWWGETAAQRDANFSLSQCLEDVIVFANSHLMLSNRNRLAVLATHSNSSHFLYPCEEEGGSENTTEVTTNDSSGIYDTFSHLTDVIKQRVNHILLSDMDEEQNPQCILAGAIAMALCYIQRISRESELEESSSRILVVKGSEDDPGQYMNFMNVVFSSQKQNVTIDACILDNDSGLLQQACDITGGIYLRVPQLTGLLQYLLWVFLPSTSVRDQLTLPPRVQVDYRAACFCHRKLIDVGYVCSVCLSIFCTFSPICSTCQSTFRLLNPGKMVKKKVKGKS